MLHHKFISYFFYPTIILPSGYLICCLLTVFLATKARNIVNNPTLPINIYITINNLPINVKFGLPPILNPTVASADTTSNEASSKSNSGSIKTINKNLTTIGIKEAEAINMDYKKALSYFKDKNIKFDLIFLDPPYNTDYIEKSLELISEYNLLNDDGLLVLEFEKEHLENSYGNLTLIKEKKYSWKYVWNIRLIAG